MFWVHLSNPARLEQGYRDIADAVEIPNRKDPKADIFQLVSSWLRDKNRRKWIMVLDNADDAAVVSKISPYLPQSPNGSVLITTRSRNAVIELVEDSEIIPVRPMEGEEAVALFKKKLGTESNSAQLVELAAALEFMPLAIVQAAAYIKQRAPRCSPQQYLEEFRKSDKQKTSLLNHKAGQLRRDPEAKNSILITWQISFDFLRDNLRSAADLLSLMSFFDQRGIPEDLLRRESTRKIGGGEDKNSVVEESNSDEGTSLESNNDRFEDDIDVLRSYSFISTKGDGMSFEMHGLVQLATRKWLETHGEAEKWKQQFIENLYAVYPTGDPENWSKCQALFPHAKSAEMQLPCDKKAVRKWGIILCNAAWYAWAKGSYSEAERISLKATEVLSKMYGKEDIDVLRCMSMLEIAYSDQGQWKKAEELGMQVIEISKRVIGTEHRDTLTSMNNLALIYSDQGQWKKAEELGMQVLEIRKRVIGTEHPDTLTNMNNLALTYNYQGLWKKAEELGMQVLEIRKRVLGAEHPDTLISMNNLVFTYNCQGLWKKAEELGMQVIEIRKRVLGTEHPGTLTSMNNLIFTYNHQGLWKKAEELGMQVIEIRNRVLRAEHPDTLISMNNLALTYEYQGQWKKAEELNIQVMEISKRVLGAEHPGTLISMGNLALTYNDQEQWKKAEELNIQVMEIRKRVLGAEHPDTLTSMNNFAFILKSQGQNNKAILLMEECFQLRKRILGSEHPYTKNSFKALSRWQMENVKMEV